MTAQAFGFLDGMLGPWLQPVTALTRGTLSLEQQTDLLFKNNHKSDLDM